MCLFILCMLTSGFTCSLYTVGQKLFGLRQGGSWTWGHWGLSPHPRRWIWGNLCSKKKRLSLEATFHFQHSHQFYISIHGPIDPFLDMDQLSCPLYRKAPLKHNVSIPMFHSGYGVLGKHLSILPPLNMSSGILLWSHLNTWSLSESSRWLQQTSGSPGHVLA